MSKVCSGCNETKELTDFWKRSSRKHGYVSRCKECGNKAQSILQKTEVVRYYRQSTGSFMSPL